MEIFLRMTLDFVKSGVCVCCQGSIGLGDIDIQYRPTDQDSFE